MITSRREIGRKSGMKFARVYVRDQLLHSILHGTDLVKSGERSRDFCGKAALFPAADSARLGSFVGIRVKEAEATRGCGSPAGLASFDLTLTTRIRPEQIDWVSLILNPTGDVGTDYDRTKPSVDYDEASRPISRIPDSLLDSRSVSYRVCALTSITKSAES